MAKEDKGIEKEIEGKIDLLQRGIDQEKVKKSFQGKYDKENTFFSIYAGTGGKDAEDWARILLRMYQRYFQKKDFKVKEIQKVIGEGGVKSITLEIKGVYPEGSLRGVFGQLKNESGVHRLVRISPFSAKKLRHTSFALVEVLPILKESKIDIKDEDLKIESFRASGPGGQYVNRRESAIRITHLPTKTVVICQSERLQGENKKRALMVLEAKLLQLKEKEKEYKIKKERGELPIAEWGNQIRSYIFHPYQMVKDHRTGIKTSDLNKVLDGDLDKFIKKRN